MMTPSARAGLLPLGILLFLVGLVSFTVVNWGLREAALVGAAIITATGVFSIIASLRGGPS